MINDYESKSKENKRKNKIDLYYEKFSDDYNVTKVKQHKEKKNTEQTELPIETYSDCNKTEIQCHKKKKKRDKNMPTETYPNFNETEIKQKEKKKNAEQIELSIETYSDCNEAEVKLHKKKTKRDKNNMSTETFFDCNETIIKHHKKKKINDIATETFSDFNETKLKHHKKKKQKDKNEMSTESGSNYFESDIQQHKKKKREKDAFSNETHSDCNEAEVKLHRKKTKRDKNNMSTEIFFDCNETKIKHHKKKNKNDMSTNQSTETFSDLNETKIKHHKKKKKKDKNEITTETGSNFLESEIQQHKKKKRENDAFSNETHYDYSETEPCKKKRKLYFFPNTNVEYGDDEIEQNTNKRKRVSVELENISQWKKSTNHNLPFSGDLCTTSFDESETNFRYKYKHRKKHSDENESNFKAIEKFYIDEEAKILAQKQKKDKISIHISEADISNKSEVCVNHKSKTKQKKCKENSSVSEQFKTSRDLSEERQKSKLHVFAIETNKNYESNIDCIDNHWETNTKHSNSVNGSEELAEIIPKRLRRKKSHANNNEAYSHKYGVTSKYFGLHSKHRESDVNASIISEVAEIVRSATNKKEGNESFLNSNRNLSEELKKSMNIEAKENCKPDINCIDNHRKKIKSNRLNVSEEFTEIIPEKLKRKKNPADNNETCLSQHDVISERNLIKAHSKCRKPDLSSSIDLEIAEIFRNSENKKEVNASNFHEEINDLLGESYVDSVNKDNKKYSRVGAIPESTLKKKKHNKDKNNVDLDNDTVYNAEINIENVCSNKYQKKSKKINSNNMHLLKDSSAINFTASTGEFTEIDISEALMNEGISHSHTVLQNNIKKRQENFALSTDEFNHRDTYLSDHQTAKENAIINITDHTDKLLEKKIANSALVSYGDCEEDPVEFEIPPLHQFETVYRLNEKQKLDMLRLNVYIKTGNFTFEEDKILKRNFEDFVKRYDISEPFSLFGTGRYQKDTELLKFLKAKHFYVRLAKGLENRTLHSIYKRARVILNPLNKLGKLTENDIETLKKLQVTHYNKWQHIGNTIGSTAERCAETYRWHEKNIAKGTFTKEEIAQLIEGIMNVCGSSDISCKNIRGISWEAVASYVPTRNSSQCRVYWATNLAWAPGSARYSWNHQCYQRLIKILKKQYPENSNIDWGKIYDESFVDFAPSKLYLQKRWLYLRSRVPGYAKKKSTKRY